MFSVGASKLAESALKFGEIASQKVVQVSETVGEKVINIFSFVTLSASCWNRFHISGGCSLSI